MRKIKEVIRLHSLGLTQQQIARSCAMAQSTVSAQLKAAYAAGLQWPEIVDWEDRCVEEAIYPATAGPTPRQRLETPDFAAIHHELQTHKHVTLQLLWEEYCQAHPDGYHYSRFCELYQRWRKKLDVVLRQEHRAGEKLFVDYAGDTVPIHDAASGEVHQASVFVAVQGASSYTYAEGTWTQALADWIAAHVHAFEYFGGVNEIVVPDNTKTGDRRQLDFPADDN